MWLLKAWLTASIWLIGGIDPHRPHPSPSIEHTSGWLGFQQYVTVAELHYSHTYSACRPACFLRAGSCFVDCSSTATALLGDWLFMETEARISSCGIACGITQFDTRPRRRKERAQTNRKWAEDNAMQVPENVALRQNECGNRSDRLGPPE